MSYKYTNVYGKVRQYDGDDVNFNHTFSNTTDADIACEELNNLQAQIEAMREVVNAAKTVTSGWLPVTESTSEKAKALIEALEALNPKTPEQLLQDRLDAADAIVNAYSYSSGSIDCLEAVSAYRKAKEEHESHVG